jgi:hypothetical protein
MALLSPLFQRVIGRKNKPYDRKKTKNVMAYTVFIIRRVVYDLVISWRYFIYLEPC